MTTIERHFSMITINGCEIIEDEEDTDFDRQVDEIRDNILKQIGEFWRNPNLSDERKRDFERILIDQSNRMECARRVHNHYVATGEVMIPK
jgi:hypothetical protein